MSNFLAQPIADDATSLKLQNVSEFAASGNIQIEDEVIAYTHSTDFDLLYLTRGVNGTSPAAHDAGLEVVEATLVSITSPLQPMSEADRDTIAAPAEGASVYNLTSHRVNVYDGSAWQEVAWSA